MTTWFTETPEDATALPEDGDTGFAWKLAIGERNGKVGLSVQSSEMGEPRLIDITSQLDSLIRGLEEARRRIGR
jgi:hypothetical protein